MVVNCKGQLKHLLFVQLIKIGSVSFCCSAFPTVVAEEFGGDKAAKIFLESAVQNHIIFSMKVKPALVAIVNVILLCLDGFFSVKNFIEAFFKNVSNLQVKVLANRYITIWKDNKAV